MKLKFLSSDLFIYLFILEIDIVLFFSIIWSERQRN